MSLKAKTLLILGLILTVIVSIAVLLSLITTQNERERSLKTRVNLITSIQADALAAPMWDLNLTQIEKQLEALSRDPDFIGAVIYDQKGEKVKDRGEVAGDKDVLVLVSDILYKEGDEEWNLGNLTLYISKDNLKESFMNQMMMSGIAFIVLLIVILSAAFVSLKMITDPLASITDAIDSLAGGDNETVIPALHRKDEIGLIAKSVQVFKENALKVAKLEKENKIQEQRNIEQRKAAMNQLASDFEASIQHIINTVSSASTEMNATAEEMSSTADASESQAKKLADSSSISADNVQTVATAAEELSASIVEVKRQISNSSEIADDATTQAQSANKTVYGLTNAAATIGEVVGAIRNIAEKINLLALNATIESARAGEAGKGFAVVASEIKNLAAQTAKATEEIDNVITSMQDETNKTADAMNIINETIEKINEISKAINSSFEEQEQAVKEIASSAQKAAQGSIEVTQGASQVSEAATKTGSSSRDLVSASSELSQQSVVLQSEVDKFLDEVRS